MDKAGAMAVVNDALGGKVRGHKYHAKPTVVDNIRFASKAEAARYDYLKFLVLSGDITDLALQPRYPLVVNGVKVCVYLGDFSYRTKEGVFTLEDVKGQILPIYRMKKKLVKALYGIDIQEVT